VCYSLWLCVLLSVVVCTAKCAALWQVYFKGDQPNIRKITEFELASGVCLTPNDATFHVCTGNIFRPDLTLFKCGDVPLNPSQAYRQSLINKSHYKGKGTLLMRVVCVVGCC